MKTTRELMEAVQLAEKAFDTTAEHPQDYCLVRAERTLAGGRCWQLVFKLERLVPSKKSSRVGAGGELFFTVDLETGEAVLTGRGE